MKWGVFEIISLNLEINEVKIKYLPEDKDFKNPPKLTWISTDPIFTQSVRTIEYDYLLTVDKVDQEVNFEEVINKNSKLEKDFLAESSVKDL